MKDICHNNIFLYTDFTVFSFFAVVFTTVFTAFAYKHRATAFATLLVDIGYAAYSKCVKLRPILIYFTCMGNEFGTKLKNTETTTNNNN